MSHVKGRDTQPEKRVRSLLHGLGYRFRLHRSDLPGKPDIVLPRHRKIIFVHGCFWHQHPGCRRAARPDDNRDFWDRKLDTTIARDARNLAALREAGWGVLIVWQCEMHDQEALMDNLRNFLAS
jgi:DNA mismatch endonuclease (patch repair protein)